MKVSFVKMTGAGNDFVMLDNLDLALSSALTKETIEALCDRRFGIGGDGLIAAEPDGDKLRMRYYNSDGGEAEMCGNGARCFTRFVGQLLGNETAPFSFETLAGTIQARFESDGRVTVGLTSPKDLKLNVLHATGTVQSPVHFINTGVPHAVAFLDNVTDIDIVRMGSFLRYHEVFAPAGTNANFAQIISPGHLKIRTYERGVEDETLACGTGMTATALIHAALTGCPSPVQLDVAGGDTLAVSFERQGYNFTNVMLTGPAYQVFEGEVELNNFPRKRQA